MISKVSFASNYSYNTPAVQKNNIHKNNTRSGKNFLIGSLIALSTLGAASCQMNDPDYNHIDRKTVYDPCCGTTQTQFKDIQNPLEKLDLMLNNLGIIDSDEISWNDIDSIRIEGDDGSEFLLENRGVFLDGNCMDFAVTRKFADGQKDSLICRMINGYGGIALRVKATNNKLIDEIPYDHAYIWQGNKDKHDDRFVIVNTAPKGLWDNVIMIEKINSNKVEILGKDGKKVNLLLDTVEVYEK